MTRKQIIDALARYRRPDTPNYEYHFQRLPATVLDKGNARALLSILADGALPAKVRDHAAGALGEIGDPRAVGPLIEALGSPKTRRGAIVALGRMKARKAAAALKPLVGKVKPARWAYSRLGLTGTVEEIIEELRCGQLRYIRTRLESLSDPLRKRVQDAIIRRFKADRREGRADLRWYVTALTTFHHPGAPALLANTLAQAWRAFGPPERPRKKPTCCGCLHARTLRALKVNPSPDAVPNLVETITSRYQRHAAAALKRLRELGGAGLSDRRLANLLERSAAIRQPIGRHVLPQVIRFVGDYGGAACRRALQGLRARGSAADKVEAAVRRIDGRMLRKSLESGYASKKSQARRAKA